MNEFEQLHPSLQYHVVNTLGWSTLRPTQLAAIPPIHAGEHCLLLAPTAGGKTEAAAIPILSRMLKESWPGTSVLYICPIKALLNNLEHRLTHHLDEEEQLVVPLIDRHLTEAEWQEVGERGFELGDGRVRATARSVRSSPNGRWCAAILLPRPRWLPAPDR